MMRCKRVRALYIHRCGHYPFVHICQSMDNMDTVVRTEFSKLNNGLPVVCLVWNQVIFGSGNLT